MNTKDNLTDVVEATDNQSADNSGQDSQGQYEVTANGGSTVTLGQDDYKTK